MRPPGIRLVHDFAKQERPRFSYGMGPSVAPLDVRKVTVNNDSAMEQACQRFHERIVRPGRDTNERRDTIRFDLARYAPRPPLKPRPYVPWRVMVRTYD
jgi:hypothetical protein